jgi:nitrite reductase/ring-hydroxylating ferredoxin subunit
MRCDSLHSGIACSFRALRFSPTATARLGRHSSARHRARERTHARTPGRRAKAFHHTSTMRAALGHATTTTTTTTATVGAGRRHRRHAGTTFAPRDARAYAGKRRGIGQILDEEFNENADKEKKEKKSAAAAKESAVKASKSEPWIKVGNIADVADKPIKALILANGNFCMVRAGSMIFITACNSTAYQYPLIDGEIFEGSLGAAIRTPLDGTSYDLATGQVLEWCPQDNLMRKFLGTLKKTESPVPLPVYPTKVDDKGDVYTYFI